MSGMDGLKCVTVITWQYLDRSGNGVVGVYEDDAAAKSTLELLNKHGDTAKAFVMKVVPYHARSAA